jgi:hypothetical protein
MSRYRRLNTIFERGHLVAFIEIAFISILVSGAMPIIKPRGHVDLVPSGWPTPFDPWRRGRSRA